MTLDQGPQTNRKRARTSKSLDGADDAKKRGRPRVEKEEDSAADRRRTQIRVAQRAYRQRKESTLEDLRKRESELVSTLESMNQAFQDFRDRLAKGSLPDMYFPGLDSVVKQYEALMKVVPNSMENDRHGIPHASTSYPDPAKSGDADRLPRPVIEIQNVPSWLDENVLSQRPKEASPLEVGMGYSLYLPKSPGIVESNSYFGPAQPAHVSAPTSSKNQSHPQMDSIMSGMANSLGLSAALPSPITYSFQETTFGRRLHRAGLEAAYQLLLDPSKRPISYERVFGLSLIRRDKTKLTAMVKKRLAQGTDESLAIYGDTPGIHIGGAGTHYLRKDHFGNVLPEKPSYNLGSVGPEILTFLEESLTSDVTVDVVGWEGKWFDPYDVEGYLQERGIFIDPSASFADAELVDSVYSSRSTSHAPSTPSPHQSLDGISGPFNQDQLHDIRTYEDDVGRLDELAVAGMSDVGYSDASTGSWMNVATSGPTAKDPTAFTAGWWEPGSVDLMANTPPVNLRDSVSSKPPPLHALRSTSSGSVTPLLRTRSVIIDVAKFIKVLLVSGMCLGRTPGFRKSDVDRALIVSSFDAF